MKDTRKAVRGRRVGSAHFSWLLPLLLLLLHLPVRAGNYAGFEDPTYRGLMGQDGYQQRRSESDAEFYEMIRREQEFFYNQEYHDRAPLRPRYTRGGMESPESPYWSRVTESRRRFSRFEILDSYFDVYWDTPNYTSNRESTPLITHLFRDAAIFPTPPGYGRRKSGITADKFMQIAIDRWDRHSREAYPIHGYWSLQDFSKDNKDFVKNFMDKFAGVNFWGQYQADRDGGISYAQSFQLIEAYIRETRLPVICLFNDKAVLVYKIVRRSDGDAAMFYWDPSDPVNMRLQNEIDAKRVIYVRQGYDTRGQFIGVQFYRITGYREARFVLEPCTGRYRQVSSGSRGTMHRLDVQPIVNMGDVYRRIAPWVKMGGYWAGLTGKDGVSTTQKVQSWTNVLASGILFADAHERGSDGEMFGHLLNGVFGSTSMSIGPGSGDRSGAGQFGAYGVSETLYMPGSMSEPWMAHGSPPSSAFDSRYYDRDPVYVPRDRGYDRGRDLPFDGYRGDRYWENDRGYSTGGGRYDRGGTVTAGYDLDRYFDWPWFKDPTYGGGNHPQPPPRYRPGYPDDAWPDPEPLPPPCQRCPPPPCNPCDPPEPPDPGYDDPANCLEITLKLDAEEYCPGKPMKIRLVVNKTKPRIRLKKDYKGEIVIDGTNRRIPFYIKKGGYGNQKHTLVSTSVPAPRTPNPYLIHARVHGADLRDQFAIRVLHPANAECGGGDGDCDKGCDDDDDPTPTPEPDDDSLVKCLELTIKIDNDDYCIGDKVNVRVFAQSTGKRFRLGKNYTGKVVFDKKTFNFTLPSGNYGTGRREVFTMNRTAPNRMGTHAVWAYVNPKRLGVADSTTFYVDECDDDPCDAKDPCGERRRRRRHDQDQDQDQDFDQDQDSYRTSRGLPDDERLTVTEEGHIVRAR